MGKKSNVAGVNLMNAIYNVSSADYKSVVPRATETNIGEISNILFNDNYLPQFNEFVGNLVNRIFKTMVSNKSFNNPLAMLKKGNYPLGVDIQDIYTNPVDGVDYELSDSAMADILKIYKGDTKAAYYRRNRRKKYPLTISREELQAAFVSWDEFEKYINSQVNAIYSGNYISEFNYTKALVDGAYEKNYIHKEIIEDVVDKDSAESLLEKLRNAYLNFAFPSEDYNGYALMNPSDTKKVTTWTEGGIILMIRSDVYSKISVRALAQAFNLEYADFLGRVIVVDKFSNSQIKAILCDEAWFQIYDNIFRMDQFYNASTMCWNYFLHSWNTFAISPFANAIVFATNDSVPLQSMSFGSASADVTMGSPKGLELTLTPNTATNTVIFEIDNTEIATVSKTDNKNCTVTPVKVGQTTLHALSDNNKEATITINVVEA